MVSLPGTGTYASRRITAFAIEKYERTTPRSLAGLGSGTLPRDPLLAGLPDRWHKDVALASQACSSSSTR
jgi:hypothetical protein